jgi:hypothetical protein
VSAGHSRTAAIGNVASSQFSNFQTKRERFPVRSVSLKNEILPTSAKDEVISSSRGVKVSIRSSDTNKSVNNNRLEKLSRPIYQDTYFCGGNGIISIREPIPVFVAQRVTLPEQTRCDCVGREQGNIMRKLKSLHTTGMLGLTYENKYRIPAERRGTILLAQAGGRAALSCHTFSPDIK